MSGAHIEIIGVGSLPEIQPGDNLSALILEACRHEDHQLVDGDVVVVTQKVVSKAEDAVVALDDIEPSAIAATFAQEFDKDPRLVELALREAKRVVKMERGVLITETRHGLVCANSGVDASNVGSNDAATTLPLDPDRSADGLREGLEDGSGASIAVIVSDTFGRPWREGVVNVAIGASGLSAFSDYRGQVDADGRSLNSTVIAIADELAAAAELVMGKLDRTPVAIVRGFPFTRSDDGAAPLVRAPRFDLFR